MADKKFFYAMHDGDSEYVIPVETDEDFWKSPRIGYRFLTEDERDEFILRTNDAAATYYRWELSVGNDDDDEEYNDDESSNFDEYDDDRELNDDELSDKYNDDQELSDNELLGVA